MKKLLTLLVLCLMCIGSAWGETYTIDFNKGTVNGTTINGQLPAQVLTMCSSGAGAEYVDSISAENVYYNASGCGLRIAKSKGTGTLCVTLSAAIQAKNIQKVIVYASAVAEDNTLTVTPTPIGSATYNATTFNNLKTYSSQTGASTNYELSAIDINGTLKSITFNANSGKYVMLHRIDIVTASLTAPTITTSNKSCSVDEIFDLSEMFESNSNGTKTYSVTAYPEGATSDNVIIDGADFSADFAGDYTIKMSQASDATAYSAGEATATLTVNSASTDPEINTIIDPATISEEEQSLSITYSIKNPLAESYTLGVSIPEDVDWIAFQTLGHNDEVGDYIQFNVAENTTFDPRSAEITLSYQDAESKTITITQEAAKLVVNYETPEYGTLVVKNGDVIVSNGGKVAYGSDLTITANPNQGYILSSFDYKEGNNDWTIGANVDDEYEITSNMTFRATFRALNNYTVKFVSRGDELTEAQTTVEEGSSLGQLPTPEVLDGFRFVGWSTVNEASADNILNEEYKPTEDLTLYAVFSYGGEIDYVKVASVDDIVTGSYLIVFGDNKAHATISGKDLAASTDELNIVNDKIASTEETDAASVTISAIEGGYTIQLPSGKYYMCSPNKNGVSEDPFHLQIGTLSGKTGFAIADGDISGTPNILYNQTSFYRCYDDKKTDATYSLPDLYKYTQTGTPTYSLCIGTARIGNEIYPTLAAAVEAVEGIATIKMIANEAVDVATNGITIPEGKNITLDLNGMEVAGVCSTKSTSALITNNGTLTIKGTGKLTYGATPTWIYEGGDDYSGSYASNLITNNGTLTVESGCLENAAEGSACYAIDNYNAGTVEINGGTIKAAKSTIRMFYGTGSLTINAGTVESGRYNIVSNSGKTSENTITIKGGTFNTTDTSYDDSGYNINGWMDGESTGSTITISGGTFNQYVYSGYTTTITGGYFASALEFENCEHFISGGFFADRPAVEYVAEGKVAIPNEDETYLWKVVAGEGNANLIQTWEHGTTYAYVQSGDEVTLKETDETLGKLTNLVITENIENVNVKYERTFKNTDWQSLYVPFEIKLTSDLLDKYGFAYINDNHLVNSLPQIEYIELENGLLKANHPYLICAELADAEKPQTIEFGTVDLCKSESKTIDCSSTSAMFNFVGVYDQTAQSTIVEQDEAQPYVMSGGKFIRLKEDANVAPYRFYMTIIARQGCEQFITLSDEIKLVNAFGDDFDEADAINEIKSETVREGAYDLMGRKVTSLVKGNVYIINGKKTLFK